MHAPDERREVEEAASRASDLERWLAASKPLAIDDDPDWIDAIVDTSRHDRKT